MKIKDSTSPLISPPPATENSSSAHLKDTTTPSAEPLSSSFTREFEEIKQLIKENRKTWFQELTSNPAVVVVLSFLLTGLAGGFLTIYQQQLAAERSFIDESNKLRIQKVGEVWEKLDQDEHSIDLLLETDDDIAAKFPTPNDRAKEIGRIISGDRALVSQYRYWLGRDISERINDYLNANIKYSIKKLSGSAEADLKTDKAARDKAKSDVDQIREALLRGVPGSRT